MRWLQPRFDFDSTAVRLLIQRSLRSQWHNLLAAVTHPIYFLKTGRSAAAHNRQAYGGNIGRRMVVARSNCGRIEVESQL